MLHIYIYIYIYIYILSDIHCMYALVYVLWVAPPVSLTRHAWLDVAGGDLL